MSTDNDPLAGLPLTKHMQEVPIAEPGFEAVGRKVAERWNVQSEPGSQALTEIAKCRTEEWAKRIAKALNMAKLPSEYDDDQEAGA